MIVRSEERILTDGFVRFVDTIRHRKYSTEFQQVPTDPTSYIVTLLREPKLITPNLFQHNI